MLLLDTGLRNPGPDAPAALINGAERVGAAGIMLGSPWSLDALPPLVAAAAAHGMLVHAAMAPIAPTKLAPGKRLPYLCATDDRDEQLAALASVQTAIDTLGGIGAGTVLVDLGQIDLGISTADILRGFARRELDDPSEGGPLGLAVTLRKERSLAVVDAVRWSLERVLRMAERASITVALRHAGLPWDAPTPRETTQLLDDFAGAPLGVAFAPGRWAVLGRIGLDPGQARLTALLERTVLVHATDAVGLSADLAPGLGEANVAIFHRLDSELTAPITLGGRPDTTVRELERAARIVSGDAA